MEIPLTENDMILARSFFSPDGDHLQGFGPPRTPADSIGIQDHTGLPPASGITSLPADSAHANMVQAQVKAKENAPGLEKDKEKPTHYKIVSFSMYNEDIDHLEDLVSRLKARGVTKANKSQVIRYALAMVDVDTMPKGW